MKNLIKFSLCLIAALVCNQNIYSYCESDALKGLEFLQQFEQENPGKIAIPAIKHPTKENVAELLEKMVDNDILNERGYTSHRQQPEIAQIAMMIKYKEQHPEKFSDCICQQLSQHAQFLRNLLCNNEKNRYFDTIYEEVSRVNDRLCDDAYNIVKEKQNLKKQQDQKSQSWWK